MQTQIHTYADGTTLHLYGRRCKQATFWYVEGYGSLGFLKSANTLHTT